METVEAAVANAWRIAANDLGITVETGGSLIDEQGRAYRYVVRVADFGSAKGAICWLIGSQDNSTLQRLAKEAGLYWSGLGEGYSDYSRDLFIATLNDWQWFGTGKPPSWYSGAPWGHEATSNTRP